ncbi:beta-ketoacyl-[acyl-carrier-protein] synthase family protein [Apibacter sp. B2966]|uniref:beta-ketoacyl-[acyl-carrier-protein] synthase family protein n=1 Tax=Apibacter sp. B2966 TaxID=2656761 RepID=UPI001409BAE0|nr:beta-ketoacyl-[acyl-carrier-protein] synthase family protein [Apibacter sp. B2966]QII72323.1 beta-ketoacyl-[acyl-carrier-protein] synthase family protein [Apibacter sp. B2966]
MRNRVVITGIGVVSPLGIKKESFLNNILIGNSGITEYMWGEKFGFVNKYIGQIPKEYKLKLKGKYPNINSEYLLYAMYAADQAMKDAGLFEIEERYFKKENMGVSVASAIADAASMEKILLKITDIENNYKKEGVNEKDWEAFNFGLAADLIAEKFDAKGCVSNLSTGCTAGLDALGLGLDMIRSGRVEVMIVGASEAPLCPLSIGSFEALGALSTRKVNSPSESSCPYSLERDGFIISEGSGMFVLETYENAKKRGAHIYAELKGYSSVNNAYHMTDLHFEGADLSECINLVIRDANCTIYDIDHISAHGSSTQQNDINETNAIKTAFKEKASTIKINSLKSMGGHALAAANAIEVVALCLEIKDQIIHPTINYKIKDIACDLDYVVEGKEEKIINAALKLSSGFSGIHSAIILTKNNEKK